MGKTVLANAFSLNMMPLDRKFTVKGIPLTVEGARELVVLEGSLHPDLVPAIGHTDTARLVGGLLGVGEADVARLVEAAQARPNVTLSHNDIVVVAQYKGPRLPEGATRLPEGARIEFVRLIVFFE